MSLYEVWLSMCCGSFLPRLREIEVDVLPVSLAMAVWNVVRMCVRSSRARAFSLDTRYTFSLGLRVVGVGVWVR